MRMTYPRAHLVDEENGGYYHCTSRCVRRAWLCGKDPITGQSFEHRKSWLEARILRLAKHFAVDLYAYTVMSNHYHIVVHTDPKRTAAWSAEEVARRWLSRSGNISRTKLSALAKELAAHPARIKLLRARLASLSWFMRGINEPLARLSNAEDDCTGRFWEGRFKSFALLDRTAIINCMVYVELNPARANPNLVIPSAHSSALLRTKTHRSPLASLRSLDITLPGYLRLIQWTHKTKSQHERGAPHRILADLGQSETQWIKSVGAHAEKYRAYGLPAAITRYVRKLNQHWIQVPTLRLLEHPPD